MKIAAIVINAIAIARNLIIILLSILSQMIAATKQQVANPFLWFFVGYASFSIAICTLSIVFLSKEIKNSAVVALDIIFGTLLGGVFYASWKPYYVNGAPNNSLGFYPSAPSPAQSFYVGQSVINKEDTPSNFGTIIPARSQGTIKSILGTRYIVEFVIDGRAILATVEGEILKA